MGIPRFFAWLKENYPEVLQDGVPEKVDWLIFDTNSLLHQAQQIVYSYGDYFDYKRAKKIRETTQEKLEKEYRDTLISLITEAVNRIKPQEGILIAIDGVAPQAKIQQQRQRRYKGPRTSDREESQEEESEEMKMLRKPIIDINRITPGTDFMFRLDEFLTSWLGTSSEETVEEREQRKLEKMGAGLGYVKKFGQYVQIGTIPKSYGNKNLTPNKNTLQWGVKKVIYSSHLVPGEGEHKYLELLRDNSIPSQGVHVINGMDADLFILSLIAPVERVYITREDIPQIINIQSFRHSLHRLMRKPSFAPDFALLTFFLGNDFLPHQPGLHDMKKGIDALVSAYVKMSKPLTESIEGGTRVIWENMVKFLEEMVENEQSLVTNEAIKGSKYPSMAMKNALKTEVRREEIKNVQEQSQNLRNQFKAQKKHTFHFDVFRDNWYQSALGPRGDTSILDFLMGRQVFPVTIDRIVEHCQSYLEGLAWNLSYYMDGVKRVSLDYVYPYHHTPLFMDLAVVAASQDSFEDGVYETPESYNFNPLHQLLAVLPFESQELLPIEIREMMNVDSSIYDMYPNQFVIDREGTNRKWEGVPLISFSESDRIIKAVKSIPIPANRWNKYLSVKELTITFTQEESEIARKQRDQLSKVQKLFPPRNQNRSRPTQPIQSRGERVIEPKTEDWRKIL